MILAKDLYNKVKQNTGKGSWYERTIEKIDNKLEEIEDKWSLTIEFDDKIDWSLLWELRCRYMSLGYLVDINDKFNWKHLRKESYIFISWDILPEQRRG